MRKSVALLPSVQRNKGLDGYVEGEAMRIVGEALLSALADRQEYDAEMFWPGYDEGDLSVQRAQQARAEAWLRTRPGAFGDKIVLNLHSDAGPSSHVLGLYGVGPDGVKRSSYALAAAVAPQVGRAMQIADVRVVSQLGDRDYSRYIFYKDQYFTSALIECGSHENRHDLLLLTGSPEVVAGGLMTGVEAYFSAQRPRPGVIWRTGRLNVTARGSIARSAPSRSGSVLRALPSGVVGTDGYTDGGQWIAGSSRWYHLAKESGYGWVHSSAGSYEDQKEGAR